MPALRTLPVRQRGVAVITALLLTTLAITIVASLFWQQQVQVRSMENQRLQLQTKWILRGALDFSIMILRADRSNYTALDGVWATPLAETRGKLLHDFPILATVLRAGLPFHQGFLNYFDQSPSAFVAAYRIEGTAQVQVQVDYLSAPSLDERVLILADPMLATGKSLVQTYRAMLRFGTPRQVHIAAVIASPEGLAYVAREIPEANLWVAAIDEGLNEQAYIMPGLGDAGDLSYGSKL